jgi:acyl carrier protein phosphodiesterase
MNFLAHTFLSFKDEHKLVGNFMADFLVNSEVTALPVNLKEGVELHKAIDAFTDNHPAVKEAIQLLRPLQGKYTPVTVDILFDYILTQKWHIYSDENMRDVVDKAYEAIQKYHSYYPPRLQEKVPRMIADDFLYACENLERLVITFGMIAKRAKFDNQFLTAHNHYILHEDELTRHFDAFFPEIVTYVKNYSYRD